MNLSLFDYDVPEAQIAQYPSEKRGSSRLLEVDRQRGELVDRQFADITDMLTDEQFLVVNNTGVLPARIAAMKFTGGKSELFFLKALGADSFAALVKGRVKAGDTLIIAGEVAVTIGEQLADGSRIVFSPIAPLELLARYGETPLPPYINRKAAARDESRYQTVYAKDSGSVAAPTAGLHFTDDILTSLQNKGVEVIELTLHVGVGTFRPIKVADIDSHTMHREEFFVSDEVAERINANIRAGKRLVAVGTTSVRTLESTAGADGFIRAGHGETELFIKPGYQFKAVKELITNFHQPKSSLLVLVSALMGYDMMKTAYAHAVGENYRFFSYGDAMYIR